MKRKKPSNFTHRSGKTKEEHCEMRYNIDLEVKKHRRIIKSSLKEYKNGILNDTEISNKLLIKQRKVKY